ncbi:hypothetical protein [Corallincola spongiicola]|uniref:DUF4149 domain-containing protein n=1 Tax=Corallincola spongiicola TaxID=2520508 RepID=A0ABY1WV08_9GAMM|nr:hypothetical protein [Corallincola spongiicola]TAA48421.1 hypothetical protein EXY25_04150 [Corallincola spongiicola]
MTHLSILIIVLRVTAIVLALNVLESFPLQYAGMGAMESETMQTLFWTSYVIPNAIKLLLAVALWLFPRSIIGVVVPDSAKGEESPEYFQNLNSACISAIGVYILCFSAADCVYYVSLNHELSSQLGYGASFTPHDQAAFIATIAELTLGLVLVIGNKALSGLLSRIRA